MSEEIDHRSAFQSRYAINEKRFGIVREVRTELPVIDVGALVEDRSLDAKQAVADEIRDALINSGFFYMTNYGVTEDEMLEVRDWSLRFFHLSREAKEPARCTDIMGPRGWHPVGDEKITPGYEGDYKEYYDFGLNLQDADVPEIERGPTFWPDEDALPGFRAHIEAYIDRMRGIGEKLMRGFALSLGLEETYFDKSHAKPFFNMRPSWYPPAKDKLHDKLWSCGPHTDYMTLTMLYQDHVGGLEVMNLDGQWIPAPPIPGTQVVNIGDMMASWTNDLYTSNPHRVRNLTNDERISLATFMGPDFKTSVECLDVCKSADNPPRYKPITCGEHVLNVMAGAMPEDVGRNARAAMSNADVTDQFRSADRIGAN